ncbi:MAG: SH3 domain-containing protein [Deltaproteobacteria bacterium]|nr:SH3 domain-containing protein [Deltaproteobacteria bacterium]
MGDRVSRAAREKLGELRKVDETTANGRFGALICALGLVISLMGCQPRVNNAPPLPPPVPPAAALPQPVRPTFYVTINQLNLRACPGLDSPKISALELNAEVEKMGEIENWTQIRVKKDGTIGYVSSRYLSPQPVKAAQPIKKKPKKAKPRKATPPPEAAGEEEEAEPKGEPFPPIPRVM